MSLKIFTIDDRLKIQRALNLKSCELEDGSLLYCALDKYEQADRRLNLNRVPEIRGMCDQILNLDSEIIQERSQSGYGAKKIRIEIEDEQEIETEYDKGVTSDEGLKERKKRLQRQLKRELELQIDNRIPLG